jgi:predicted RNase H-like HicB family nuclease
MHYIGLIHKDAGSEYGVSFPDFPGCVTAGASLEEARLMAQEALNLHIEGMIEDGESLPAASTLDEILADPENAGTVAVLTVAPRRSSKAVRLNVTLPEDVLLRIDDYARKHGLSRSGFLAQAAKQVLEDA